MLLGYVDSSIDRNDRIKEFIKHDFRILIEDDQDTDFWRDDWIGKDEMRVSFTGINALSWSKSGLVKVFGKWDE